MISALNHRRPLNGNKWLLILTLFLAFSSCDFFKKAQDTSKVTSKKAGSGIGRIKGAKGL